MAAQVAQNQTRGMREQRLPANSEYQRVKALLDLEATYPLLDEVFREGWEALGMADYDRYDELNPQ
jgi:hypothetical protein